MAKKVADTVLLALGAAHISTQRARHRVALRSDEAANALFVAAGRAFGMPCEELGQAMQALRDRRESVILDAVAASKVVATGAFLDMKAIDSSIISGRLEFSYITMGGDGASSSELSADFTVLRSTGTKLVGRWFTGLALDRHQAPTGLVGASAAGNFKAMSDDFGATRAFAVDVHGQLVDIPEILHARLKQVGAQIGECLHAGGVRASDADLLVGQSCELVRRDRRAKPR